MKMLLKRMIRYAVAPLLAACAAAVVYAANAPTYLDADGKRFGAQGVVIVNPDGSFGNTTGATQSGENHIGEVGNNSTNFNVNPTVSTSAFSAGMSVGGKITVTGATRVSGSLGAGGTSGYIQTITMTSGTTSHTSQVDVFIFDADIAGTCTDHTAVAFGAADMANLVGVAHITDWTADNDNLPVAGQATNLALPYEIAGGTSLYACAIERGTPTFASAFDVRFKFHLLRN